MFSCIKPKPRKVGLSLGFLSQATRVSAFEHFHPQQMWRDARIQPARLGPLQETFIQSVISRPRSVPPPSGSASYLNQLRSPAAPHPCSPINHFRDFQVVHDASRARVTERRRRCNKETHAFCSMRMTPMHCWTISSSSSNAARIATGVRGFGKR